MCFPRRRQVTLSGDVLLEQHPWPRGRACLVVPLQHGQVALDLVVVHLRAVGVPLDPLVLDELGEDVVAERPTDELGAFHAGDRLVGSLLVSAEAATLRAARHLAVAPLVLALNVAG